VLITPDSIDWSCVCHGLNVGVLLALAVLEVLVPPVDPPIPNPTEFLLGQSHRYRVHRPPAPQRLMAQHAFDRPVPRRPANGKAVVLRDERQNLDNRRALEHPPARPQDGVRRGRESPQPAREQHVQDSYYLARWLEYDYPPELPVLQHSERPGRPESPTV
jgi:hypothetical protein